MEISLSCLQSFLFGLEQIPPNTPRRWELIAELVSRLTSSQVSIENAEIEPQLLKQDVIIQIGKGTPQCGFVSSAKCCKKFGFLEDSCVGWSRNDILSYAERIYYKDDEIPSLKPLVLMPSVLECCSTRIRVDPRPSFPLVYTLNGTMVAAMFHGQCKKCDNRFYHSYKETKSRDDKTLRYYNDPMNDQEYFQYSSATVFQKKLLSDITHNIVFSAATFESRAQVYIANNKITDRIRLQHLETHQASKLREWCPSAKRLEDSWFMWCIILEYAQLGMLESTNLFVEYTSMGKRRDLENLCECLWEVIASRRNKWVMHKCSIKGCAEGYVTIDGNEKLHRPICGVPHSRCQIRRDLPVIVKCCTNFPIIGGKNQTPSKYCEIHEKDHENESSAPIEFRNVNAEYTGNLPDNDDDSILTGCKRPQNRAKFYSTTAGMLALIRPCGIVVAMTEMYTCESATQVFLFLLRTFVHDVNTVMRLKYLGYDRACDLKPFLVNQSKHGSAGAKLLLDNVKFLVDIFHCEKHTELTCMPLNNPRCEYHPKLPIFKEIHGVNTESYEQGFRRLSK